MPFTPPKPVVPQSPPRGYLPNADFFCVHCGARLTIREPVTNAAGPCPCCGNWLAGPGSPPVQAPLVASLAGEPAQPAQDSRRKGHIRGDLTVDVIHQDRREATRTLIVIAMFIVAAGVCATVFYLMTGWRG